MRTPAYTRQPIQCTPVSLVSQRSRWPPRSSRKPAGRCSTRPLADTNAAAVYDSSYFNDSRIGSDLMWGELSRGKKTSMTLMILMGCSSFTKSKRRCGHRLDAGAPTGRRLFPVFERSTLCTVPFATSIPPNLDVAYTIRQTWHKKIIVTVTSPSSNDTLVYPSIMSYWN